MSTSLHVLIPFASSLDEHCHQTISELKLASLSQLLKQTTCSQVVGTDEFERLTPLEQVLGVSNQIIVTPCHWDVGINQIRMSNPDELNLSDAESRELLSVLTPSFLSEGLQPNYVSPTRWLLSQPYAVHSTAPSQRSEGLLATTNLELTSLDRVIGRGIEPWQLRGERSKNLRRLQNEIQMLLHTHPINQARQKVGSQTINSFWLSYALRQSDWTSVKILSELRVSALQGNWAAWGLAWGSLEQKLSDLIQNIQLPLSITLCGERYAKTYALPTHRTFTQKALRFVRGITQAKLFANEVLLSL